MTLDLDTYFFRREDRVYSLRGVSCSVQQWYPGNGVIVCEKIKVFLIWPLSQRWDEVQIIFSHFPLPIPLFSFCSVSAWCCLLHSRVHFTRASGHVQSHHISDRPFFDRVICPFLILNGSHTGEKRPKKELNKVEFSFEIQEFPPYRVPLLFLSFTQSPQDMCSKDFPGVFLHLFVC